VAFVIQAFAKERAGPLGDANEGEEAGLLQLSLVMWPYAYLALQLAVEVQMSLGGGAAACGMAILDRLIKEPQSPNTPDSAQSAV
jgi:hypothetical protein